MTAVSDAGEAIAASREMDAAWRDAAAARANFDEAARQYEATLLAVVQLEAAEAAADWLGPDAPRVGAVLVTEPDSTHMHLLGLVDDAGHVLVDIDGNGAVGRDDQDRAEFIGRLDEDVDDELHILASLGFEPGTRGDQHVIPVPEAVASAAQQRTRESRLTASESASAAFHAADSGQPQPALPVPPAPRPARPPRPGADVVALLQREPGLSYQQLGVALGRSPRTVQGQVRAARARGDLPPNPRPPSRYDDVVALLREQPDLALHEVAAALDTTITTVVKHKRTARERGEIPPTAGRSPSRYDDVVALLREQPDLALHEVAEALNTTVRTVAKHESAARERGEIPPKTRTDHGAVEPAGASPDVALDPVGRQPARPSPLRAAFPGQPRAMNRIAVEENRRPPVAPSEAPPSERGPRR